MLAVNYLPLEDEMPVSWLNRLAKSNGFHNIEELAFIFSIYKKSNGNNKNIMNHFNQIIEICDFNEELKSKLDSYKKIMTVTERLIGDLADKNIKLCPICMKEDLEKHGQISHRFQHQFAGSNICWKHNVNLIKIQQQDYFQTTPEHIHITQIDGNYDSQREMEIMKLFDVATDQFFNEFVRYRLKILLDINELSLDQVDLLLPNMNMFNDLYEKFKRLLTGSEEAINFDNYEKMFVLRLLFDDAYKFQNILRKKQNEN